MSQNIYRFSWLDKNKKAAINPINKSNNKCFQYIARFALYLEELEKNSERITTTKPFIDKYN